ncbi:MAG: YciI family protein [Chloroflexi bacterium]|nr:YciI family protein [Chloroflexota bacterium]
MRYMLLIYDNEKAREGMSQEEMAAHIDTWMKYTDAFQKSGKMLAGEALQLTPSATTIRLEHDRTLMTDGPFAETKEQLGGYFIMDANDLDEAIEWAAKMPHVSTGGSVEVRPVREIPNQ